MTENIDPITRQQIADFLPIAISKTLKSYEIFTQELEYIKSTDFLSHHNACKAAITHLELLLKLARWANISSDNNEDQALMNLISLAEKQVKENRNNN